MVVLPDQARSRPRSHRGVLLRRPREFSRPKSEASRSFAATQASAFARRATASSRASRMTIASSSSVGSVSGAIKSRVVMGASQVQHPSRKAEARRAGERGSPTNLKSRGPRDGLMLTDRVDPESSARDRRVEVNRERCSSVSELFESLRNSCSSAFRTRSRMPR